MELRIFTEPQQGASYDQLLEVARTAEESGFDAFFRSDHYLRMGGGDPRPGPTDAWTTLAGLARETTRIRLGTLMTAATFRLPGPLAVTVAQVDEMSDGRVELGIGAGWFDEEHRAYGIPFAPSFGERFDRLEEQLEILTGIWTASPEDPFSFSGRHYELESNPGLPQPAQRPHPPLIVGGHGTRRTPHLAARFAAECNVPFAGPEDCVRVFSAVDRACEKAGRDPSSVVRSVAQVVCCAGRDRELERRAKAIGREVGELKANGAAGTPAEVSERLASFSGVGVSRVYLQVLDLTDLDHLRLIASDVYPSVRGI
jgi:F420-dependent oxidoreductase-like protein